MLIVENKPIMLSVIMLNVVMLSVAMLSVVAPLVTVSHFHPLRGSSLRVGTRDRTHNPSFYSYLTDWPFKVVLHNIRLERLDSDEHSSLLCPFVS
jgi:hypothetical protein